MKKNSVATDIAYVAVFTALIIVFAFVSIPSPVSGVPIVIQNAVITLAGLVLGGRRGFFVGLLFIVLGLVGLPVLAGGRSVISALPGPTVGYIVGYLISPAIGGAVAYRAPRNKTGLAIMITVAGFVSLLIQYACGTVGLALRAGMGWGEAALAQIPFLGPDALKLVIMIIIAIGVHSAFPDLMGRKPVAKKAEPAA
ncbi:biotin transporter BioY [Corynebacterium striatum]|uniref:biotin transporter BioY n=1 Tax=Corynebacterium striatum TaxID=43770 RepID=UPI000C64A98F|nr:biotin transporter BioY [Corynebacterium striatum]MBD0856769.1 biotin transporter BioY [Corynebacterium striatum]PIS59495.1 biotin biosynthesis protein BioY [Corynebacterium striatum]PIS63316.1 biotin biosynthesis protein BioY [Corynebacterium striatum]PIS66839.1 biotin biosynthesis protein BioY [Corynebacterium striatum]PXY06701.1 biotin transporter BioY [Corynebacterium striatum]